MTDELKEREITIDDLMREVSGFKEKLTAIRSQDSPPGGWYQYDSLSNVWILDQLLTGEYRSISFMADGLKIADFGAADGDTALFLNHLGLAVDIVDHAATNQNGLNGARLLVDRLQSSVGIYDVNLDRGFWSPNDRYGLTLFLGILYHLQNPYGALQNLAQISNYCLVSTRITRLAQDRIRDISDIPAAYLVDTFETNNDPTNYWIFTEAGLRRLFARTGWDIVNLLCLGDTTASDPFSMQHDERAFALLRRS